MKKQFSFFAHNRNEISGIVSKIDSIFYIPYKYEFRFCEDGSVLFRDPKNDTISEFLSGKYVLYDKNFCRIGPAFVPIITEETV